MRIGAISLAVLCGACSQTVLDGDGGSWSPDRPPTRDGDVSRPDATTPDQGTIEDSGAPTDAALSDQGVIMDSGPPADSGTRPPDVGSVPDRLLLLADELDTTADWNLVTSGVTPGQMDSATATIAGGRLTVSAGQEYGCPRATAVRTISNPVTPPAALRRLEFAAETTHLTHNALGVLRLVFTYADTRATVRLVQWQPQGGTLRVVTGAPASATLDGQPLHVDRWEIESRPGAAPRIEVEAEACGADGYAGAGAVVERFQIDAIR